MIATLRRLYRFFEPLRLFWRWAVGLASTVVLRRIYDIALTILMKDITNSFQSWDIQQVNKLLIIGWVSFIVYHIVWYILQKHNLYSSIKLPKIINRKYLTKIFEKDHLYRENQWTGKMITHIKDWINRRAEFNVMFTHRTVSIIMNIIWAVIIISTWWLRYFLWLLIVLVISTQVSIFFRKKADILRKQKYEARTASNKQLIKMIMSRNDIIYNNQADQQVEAFERNLDQEIYRGTKQRPYEHIGFNITSGTIDIAKIVILVILWHQVLWWTIGFGDLLASTTIIGLLSKAINDYIESLREYMKNGINIENLRKIIDETPSILWYESGQDFKYQSGTIIFDKVSFAYGDKEVITNCTLTIPGGKKIALVWHSGGGKTTIAKLIAGYLHPSSWSILIDKQALPSTGKRIRKFVNLKSYYHHIAYLTQEPSVFDGTIFENLTFWLDVDHIARLSSSSELSDSIKKAQCEFIYDFPQGLDTEIWEKGVKLSWWQRQRLAIARVFLKNPEIIILDEPTSALDSISEHEITKAMHNLFVGRTVIIIAHRLQTVKDSDIIIMIEQGHIKAQWTHNELLQTNAHYKELVNLQSGW